MVTVQVAPPANPLPQVFVWLKSLALAPDSVIPLMVRLVLPRFVTVTVLALPDRPTVITPKFRDDGETVTAVPIPVTGTTCGPPGALSLILIDAVRVPAALGVKVTVM